MSVCSRNFGALSRSRLPPAKTLVPFLYQTATIQQWKPIRQPLPYRNTSSRSRIEQDIPFESDVESPHIQDAATPRGSTITGPERAAFETLHKKFRTQRPTRQRPRSSGDKVADDYYEDDDQTTADADAASLDSLFAEVFSKSTKGTRLRTFGAKKDDMGSLAKQILAPEKKIAKKETESARKDREEKIKALQLSERARIRTLLGAAQTDRELWIVLEKEVFEVMRSLKLDEKATQVGKQRKNGNQKVLSIPAIAQPPPRFPTKPTDAAFNQVDVRDPVIFFPNFSSHIMDATKILLRDFPSSPLPFTMIPTLKSLGRSAYILGATTSLFRAVLRATWLRQHSYSRMCALLQDMSNSGVEPNLKTLELLDEILDEYRIGQQGKLGRSLSAMWLFKSTSESAKQLTAWRDGIAKKLSVEGSRASSTMVVKKKHLIHRLQKREDPLALLDALAAGEKRYPSEKEKTTANDDQIFPGERDSENGATWEESSVVSQHNLEGASVLESPSSAVQNDIENHALQHEPLSSHEDAGAVLPSERQHPEDHKERNGNP